MIKNKDISAFNVTLYKRILDECGGSDIAQKDIFQILLEFFYNFPLIMNAEEIPANGTPYRGLNIELKPGCFFVKENWEGYIVNTKYFDQTEHIVGMKEGNAVHDEISDLKKIFVKKY